RVFRLVHLSLWAGAHLHRDGGLGLPPRVPEGKKSSVERARARRIQHGARVDGILSGMRVLLVHPSALMYSELYLRLEPIGLERVAAALRAAGHDVRVLDLQIFTHDDYRTELAAFRPQAVGFSM